MYDDIPFGEFGEVEVDASGSGGTINFTGSYTDPVVLAGPITDKESDAAAVRVTAVSGGGAELTLQEPSGGGHIKETVSYLVAETGEFDLDDGTAIEVGTQDIGANGNAFDSVTFDRTFPETPQILSQIQTVNESHFAVTRQRNGSQTGVEVNVQEDEGADGTHATEEVAYLAIDPSGGGVDGTFNNGVIFESGEQSGVEGRNNGATLPFGTVTGSDKQVLAQQATFVGPNTSWVRFKGTSSEDVFSEEDQTSDSERNHADETVDFIGLDGNADTLTADTAVLVTDTRVSLTPVPSDQTTTAGLEIEVDFNQPMDTSGGAPTLSFPAADPSPTLDLNTGQSGYIDNDTYKAVYDLNPSNQLLDDVDVTIDGAETQAGRTQAIPIPRPDLFDVGTANNALTISSLSASPDPLDADMGGQTFTIAVTFGQDMNQSVEPTFALSPGVGSTLTFDAGASGYQNATTYEAVYSTSDSGQIATNIDVQVNGATTDLGGSANLSQSDVFSIGSVDAGLSLADVQTNLNRVTPSDDGDTFEVTFEFNQAMDTSVQPTVDFPNDSVGPTLNFDAGASGWDNATDYTAAYTIDDAGQVINGVDVAIGNATTDLGGDQPGQFTRADTFAIGPAAASERDIIEFDTITLTADPKTVTFDRDFVDPIVIASPITDTDTETADVRVLDVQSDEATLRLQEPDGDGMHGAETVRYLVAEQGRWRLDDGTDIEIDTRAIDADRGNTETVTFDQGFDDTPQVLSQTQTVNEDRFISTRHENRTTTGVDIGLQEPRTGSDTHATEDVGYLAIDPQNADNTAEDIPGGQRLETAVVQNIQGRGNGKAPSFTSGFDSSDSIFAHMSTLNGGDPSFVRFESSGTTELFVEEDQLADGERNHTNEDVDVVAFEGASGSVEAQQAGSPPAPTVTAVTPHVPQISPNLTGTQAFALDVRFDRAMNDGFAPSLSFPNDSVGATLTPNTGASGFVAPDTYRAVFDVTDTGQSVDGVDVRVADGISAVGADQASPVTKADVFDIGDLTFSDEAGLFAAMRAANQTPGADTIVFDGASPTTITLDGDGLANLGLSPGAIQNGALPLVRGDLTIDGGGNLTIDGADTFRPFFAWSGTLTLTDLDIANGAARGGDGGDGAGAGAGGGGGLGAGGAVFVNQGARAVLDDVTLSGNAARGGDGGDAGGGAGPALAGGGGGGLGGPGGDAAATSAGGAGGGGGLFGVGGAPVNGAYGGGGGGGAFGRGGTTTGMDGEAGGGGGGGLFASGGDGTTNGGGGGGGAVAPGDDGDTHANGGGASGGDGNTGPGAGDPGGVHGGGGGGGDLDIDRALDGGSGGRFAGGGGGGAREGAGGDGGAGAGGGGAGGPDGGNGDGGVGGDGGVFGGGGGSGTGFGAAGSGGYGAGGGGSDGTGRAPGGFGAGDGGTAGGTTGGDGGSAFGGQIFIRDGGAIELTDTTITGGGVTAGTGGNPGGNDGTRAVAGAFAEGDATVTTRVTSGTETIADALGDDEPSLDDQSDDSALTLQKTGSGTLALTADNKHDGGTDIRAGTLAVPTANALGSGAVALANDASLAVNGVTTIANDVTVDAGGGTIRHGPDVTYSGAISGSGRLRKDGGGTATLTGNNSYGDTVLADGVLAVPNASSLGNGAVDVDGAVLRVTGTGTTTIGNDVTLTATGSTIDIANASAATTISGAVGGSGGLVKTGAGTLVVAGTNSVSGDQTVQAGILSVQSGANLGSGPVVLDGGELRVTGTGALDLGTNLDVLSGGGTLTLPDASADLDVADLSGAGGLTVNGDGALALGTDALQAFTGAITLTGGSGLALSDAQADSPSDGAITLTGSARLSGDGGTARAVTAQTGTTVAPGASTGVLETGDVTLDGGSTLDIEIDGGTPGSGHDQIAVTGTVDIKSGAVLDVSRPNDFVPAFGQEFTIIDNDGSDPVTGVGNLETPGGTPLTDGDTFTLDSRRFEIQYDSGDGNDVVLIDRTRPISSASIAEVADADAGSQLTVSADFNLPMNTGIAPDVSFPTPGEDASPTLALQPGPSGWQANDEVYDAVFAIQDADQHIPDVDIRFDDVRDANGDPVPVVTSNNVVHIDMRPPSVDVGASVPADGATDVGLDAPIAIEYSEAIDFGASGQIAILRETGSGPVTVADYDVSTVPGALGISGSTLTLDPSGDLPGTATLFARIDAGAITDHADNPAAAFDGQGTLDFTTQDPTILETTGAAFDTTDGTQIRFADTAGAADETIQIASPAHLAGSVLDGGGGDDRVEFTSGGTFDLTTLATLAEVETVAIADGADTTVVGTGAGERIIAGDGADTLRPNGGGDTLTGGDGGDSFVDPNGSTITDLSQADTIRLTGVTGLSGTDVRVSGNTVTVDRDTNGTFGNPADSTFTLTTVPPGEIAVGTTGGDTTLTFADPPDPTPPAPAPPPPQPDPEPEPQPDPDPEPDGPPVTATNGNGERLATAIASSDLTDGDRRVIVEQDVVTAGGETATRIVDATISTSDGDGGARVTTADVTITRPSGETVSLTETTTATTETRPNGRVERSREVIARPDGTTETTTRVTTTTTRQDPDATTRTTAITGPNGAVGTVTRERVTDADGDPRERLSATVSAPDGTAPADQVTSFDLVESELDLPDLPGVENRGPVQVDVVPGASVSAAGPEGRIDPDTARTELIALIRARTEDDPRDRADLSAEGRAYLDRIAADTSLTARAVVPQTDGPVATPADAAAPITIRGEVGGTTANRQEALVVDARAGASGGDGDTPIALENIEFAAVVGPGTFRDGAGTNHFAGDGAAQTIAGGTGDDRISAGRGADRVTGGAGDDTLRASGGHNTFDGGAGDDGITGGDGPEALRGGTGDDTIDGGIAEDSLTGGDDQDTLDGGPGDDALNGGPGDDTVLGATGDDGLAGGPGADMLDGGPGDDLLAGGPGPDRFALSPGDDRITDFDPGADTVIVPANAPPSAITTGATPAGNARVDGAAADSGTLTLVGIAPSELDTDAFPGL